MKIVNISKGKYNNQEFICQVLDKPYGSSFYFCKIVQVIKGLSGSEIGGEYQWSLGEDFTYLEGQDAPE